MKGRAFNRGHPFCDKGCLTGKRRPVFVGTHNLGKGGGVERKRKRKRPREIRRISAVKRGGQHGGGGGEEGKGK